MSIPAPGTRPARARSSARPEVRLDRSLDLAPHDAWQRLHEDWLPSWFGVGSVPQQVGATISLADGGHVRITGWSSGRRLLARVSPAGTAHPTTLQITVEPAGHRGSVLTVAHHDVPGEPERARLRSAWTERLAVLGHVARD
jgi:hypothetical protein